MIPVSGISRSTPPTIDEDLQRELNDEAGGEQFREGSRTATAVRRPRETMRP